MMLTASIGMRTATRKASMVAPVPKRRATRSSFATAASFVMGVRIEVVVAARKPCRLVEPLVNRSHGPRRLFRRLAKVNGTRNGKGTGYLMKRLVVRYSRIASTLVSG